MKNITRKLRSSLRSISVVPQQLQTPEASSSADSQIQAVQETVLPTSHIIMLTPSDAKPKNEQPTPTVFKDMVMSLDGSRNADPDPTTSERSHDGQFNEAMGATQFNSNISTENRKGYFRCYNYANSRSRWRPRGGGSDRLGIPEKVDKGCKRV